MKFTVLLALLTATACGGNTASTGLGPRSCPADRLINVTNDWNGTVDIYARLEGSDGRRALGTLAAGGHAEFVAPPGTFEVYALQAGRDEPNALTMTMRRYVRFRITCR